MELAPGVFVSTVSADEWEPDPDVPGTEMHELVHDGAVWAGLTRISSVDGPITWTPEQRETIHVLEGSVRIEIADGPTLELKPGNIASLPAGSATTWHVTTPFKEFWVLA
jgi:uncharacterized cupin superfamily protein